MVKLHDPRVVKIFFSSPFGGMEKEREELTRRYFPQIHHACNAKGLQFVAVDMRWGITAESSENAQVINICLREIDRSDMFIGFFGQRYGWNGVEDKFLQANFDNAVGRYPWLNTVRDKSVTELEFLHGFLNNPGQLPATLLFRDKSYDDKMCAEGKERGDHKQVFKYRAQSEHAAKLLDDLKQRVYQNKDKSLGVHMSYKTPSEAAKLMFEAIMKYLNDILFVDLVLKSMSHREELLSQHDSFLASRCNIFVGGEKFLQQFDTQLAQANPEPMLVTGAPGSGKSALLCNLVSRLKQDSTYAVVYHFVGFAEASAEITHILLRLVDEFQFCLSQLTGTAVSETKSDEDLNFEDEGERHRDLIQKLLLTMEALIKAGKTPAIILDGIDKVKHESKLGKAVYWIPENFPTSTVVVVSTLSSDTRTIETLWQRHYVTMNMESLSLDSQQEMCVKTLAASGKELSPGQLERVVAAIMTKNPLFLKITLNELISFGHFRLLDQKIDSLISSKSIKELFGKFLQRLEEDYNVEYEGNLVEEVMCSITLSRQGMSETELKTMFDIPDHVWSPLYFAIEPMIIDQSGLIKFGFSELKDAVEVKYLKDGKTRQAHLQKLIDYFQDELKEMRLGPDSSKHRPIFELPWLLQEIGDKKALAECLSNYNVFVLLEKNNVYDLVYLWRQTGITKQETVDKLLQTYNDTVADLWVHMEKRYLLDTCVTPGIYLETFLRRLDRFLSQCGFHEEREKVILRSIQVLEGSLKHKVVKDRETLEQTLMEQKYKLACLYCQSYHQENKGIQLHEQLLENLEREMAASSVPPTAEQYQRMGHYYHGIGVGLMALKQYEKMLEYTKKSMECHEKYEQTTSSQRDIASSYGNIGLAYMELGNLEEALINFKTCLKLNEEAHFGHLPPVIGEMLTNMALCYRKMGQLDDAEEMYKKSLKVKINALGHDHSVVAVTYMNLGTLEMYRENSAKSQAYNKEAVEIFERLGQTWSNPQYIMSQENLLAAMLDLQRFQEADELAMKILEWRVKDKSMDNCIPTVYREMVKYYIREERWEEAYKVCYALLDSKHKEEYVSYIHMDWIVSSLGERFQQKLPEEFTMEYAIEKWPDNVYLIKYHVENSLVPDHDTEEIVRLINRLHGLSDMGADVYVLSCAWCAVDGVIQEHSYRSVVEEGLKIYPDNLELLLAIGKSHRRQDDPTQALPYLIKVAEQQSENLPLLILTAQTAALAGEFDSCRKYCDTVLSQDPEAEPKFQAQQLLDMVNEIGKGTAEQNTDQSQSESDKQEVTSPIRNQSE